MEVVEEVGVAARPVDGRQRLAQPAPVAEHDRPRLADGAPLVRLLGHLAHRREGRVAAAEDLGQAGADQAVERLRRLDRDKSRRLDPVTGHGHQATSPDANGVVAAVHHLRRPPPAGDAGAHGGRARPGTLDAVETLASRQVYANPWMTVREVALLRADGSTGIYGVVDTPDIALVIPADGDRLHLVEQYRHPVAGRRWEFPSGSADQKLDADASEVAARELREETGLVASSLVPLGTLDVTPSTLNQRCSVFVATDLTQGPPQRDQEERDMRSAWFTRADIERRIKDGVITDAKSVAAYALLLMTEAPSHG